MDHSEKFTFNLTLVLVIIIIAATLVIFMLTPSPVSPTRVFFGYITGVYTKGKTVYLNFDPARWLTDNNSGFSATIACVKDGNCTNCPLPPTKSCIPGDYYIHNSDTKNVAYPVIPFAKVGTLILNPDWNDTDSNSKPYRTLSLAEFQDIYIKSESPESWIRTAPFNITVIAGRVIIINQHYIP